MFSNTHHSSPHTNPSREKMITGALEGKLVATKILLKQGMAWATIAELMDMTEEQIAYVQSDFHGCTLKHGTTHLAIGKSDHRVV